MVLFCLLRIRQPAVASSPPRTELNRLNIFIFVPLQVVSHGPNFAFFDFNPARWVV